MITVVVKEKNLENFLDNLKSVVSKFSYLMEYIIYVVHHRFQNSTPQDIPKNLLGSFPSYSEAKVFCDHLMSKEKADGDMQLDISPIPLLFNIDEKPCARISPKNHIPFDTRQMEFPIRCDLCRKNARFFCLIHSGLFCLFHVSMHD